MSLVKERLEKAEESRESIVTAKHEKAFQRAKESLEFKQEKLRNMFSKVSEVKERRTILEQERRKHVMASMESRLSSATMRVDNMVQKRQGRVRYNKRRKQAVERRKKVDDYRERILNVRYEKALLRAKESLQFKQDKFRDMFSKVTIVKERRTMLEQKRRKRVLTSRASRLNSALTRAEHLVQMKQGRARYDKRRKRARDKRVSLEFERKTHLLSTIDNRSERATRNLKLKLLDRQFKAREKVERAVCVSRRVKAARLLQKVMRKKFRLGNDLDSDSQALLQVYQSTAATRLQNFWRAHLVLKHMKSDDMLLSPMKSLALILADMGLSSRENPPAEQSFEQLALNITRAPMLKSAHIFLNAFRPFLQCDSYRKGKSCILSNRTLLSAFLILHHPDEVLGEKRCGDKCSKLLEKSSKILIDQLRYFADFLNHSEGNNAHLMHVAINDLVATFISYGTLFNAWKDADLDELISHMSVRAEQSWVVYLTSKDALAYGNERVMVLSKKQEDDVLFQNCLNHKSAKKGAYNLIKRIRTSFDKLVGKEEALQIMRHAKQCAVQKIETEHMMEPLKAEINHKLQKEEEEYFDHEQKQDINPNVEGIPNNLFSNADLVHKILLSGSSNTDDLLMQTPNGYKEEIFDTANDFMTYWHQRHAILSNTDNVESLEGVTAMTMELAYFDQIEHNLIANQGLKGIQNLVLNLCQKMRQLVPNRLDLHNFISDDDVTSCRSIADVLKLLNKMSRIMSDELEAPYRSPSTVEWRETSEAYTDSNELMSKNIPYNFNKLESFIVASISFLLKKIDLCHFDKMKFELKKVTPLILQIGGEYERNQMQLKYGDFGSFSSMSELSATWGWVHRAQEAFMMSPKMLIGTLKTDCFVDELLFVKDAIPMPEVLSLDGEAIKKIRKLAQTAVFGSALFLHACNIAGSQLDSLTSQAQYHRSQLISLLNRTPSYESLSDALTNFIEAIDRRELDPVKKASLRRLVESVCDGNDPVLKLLDSRMRQLFKFACGLSCFVENIPMTIRTGISNDVNKYGSSEKSCSIKEQFMTQCGSEANRLGFGMFSDDLVKVVYEASNVINHAVCLYKDDIFLPLFKEMIHIDIDE